MSPVHSPGDGRTGCFYDSAIMSCAAVNAGAPASMWCDVFNVSFIFELVVMGLNPGHAPPRSLRLSFIGKPGTRERISEFFQERGPSEASLLLPVSLHNIVARVQTHSSDTFSFPATDPTPCPFPGPLSPLCARVPDTEGESLLAYQCCLLHKFGSHAPHLPVEVLGISMAQNHCFFCALQAGISPSASLRCLQQCPPQRLAPLHSSKMESKAEKSTAAPGHPVRV
ncbi:uncharacterized protein LOC117287152 [Fukomys damarensis]|uniref:uncharacterized protein LOC117287152 n=1 Tax=Fukomys damarensis TaxID=885580 RepID=UPI0014555840|nr:uncharacterized protein LOC117287152 [Fukomys damarensis]